MRAGATILTFRAQALLTEAGGGDSHAINVLYAAATLRGARIFSRRARRPAATTTGGCRRARSRVALLGGVLFALHRCVEAVTGWSAVPGLCALFFASAAAFRASAEGADGAEAAARRWGWARRCARGGGVTGGRDAARRRSARAARRSPPTAASARPPRPSSRGALLVRAPRAMPSAALSAGAGRRSRSRRRRSRSRS